MKKSSIFALCLTVLAINPRASADMIKICVSADKSLSYSHIISYHDDPSHSNVRTLKYLGYQQINHGSDTKDQPIDLTVTQHAEISIEADSRLTTVNYVEEVVGAVVDDVSLSRVEFSKTWICEEKTAVFLPMPN